MKTNKTGAAIGMDWDKFSASIGLTGDKVSRGALDEMLKASGADIRDLQNLVDVASQIVVPLDVSDFLKRRLTIGGAGGLATLFKFAQGSALRSLGVGLMFFRGGSVISSPQSLKAMRTILDPSKPENMRRVLLGKLIDQVVSQEEFRGDEFIGAAQ